MRDEEMSRERLLEELRVLRQRVQQLQAASDPTWVGRETMEESQDRFRTLFETATEGIIIIDLDTREIRYANAAAAGLFGRELADLRTCVLAQLCPSDKPETILELLEEVAEGDRSELQELPCQRKDGEIFYADATATLGIVGGREAVILFLRDVTDRKRARDDMLSIIDSLGQVSALTDEVGCITFLSDTGLRLLGRTREEMLGTPWEKALPFAKEPHRRIRESLALPEAERTQIPALLHLPGGGRAWMEVSVLDDPRDARRKMFFLKDVTELHDLRRRLEGAQRYHDMVGRSDAMREVFRRIQEIAAVNWTVLIEGETGSGKDLVARALHAASPRRDAPFVAVNCASLAESLLASQLFGHRKGAFTGATRDQEGFFEAASGGTLFLDEIGDISAGVQASLLRVLEAKEVTRVGESRPRPVDVRVIVATHRDLVAEVAAERFRSDLLYRIRVARVELPPLRGRREDIPLLVAEFLRTSATATDKAVQDISDDAMRALMEHSWPGNVRELKSAIVYAVLHCGNEHVRTEDLPPEIRGVPGDAVVPAALPAGPEGERVRILDALQRSRGKRAAAARLLGISRATFYRRLDELGISTNEI